MMVPVLHEDQDIETMTIDEMKGELRELRYWKKETAKENGVMNDAEQRTKKVGAVQRLGCRGRAVGRGVCQITLESQHFSPSSCSAAIFETELTPTLAEDDQADLSGRLQGRPGHLSSPDSVQAQAFQDVR